MSDDAEPDDSEPTPERQAELQAAYQANAKAGRAPYAGVHVRSQGELLWIAQARHWWVAPGAVEVADQPTLNRGSVSGANLREVYRAGVNLTGTGDRKRPRRAHATREASDLAVSGVVRSGSAPPW
jgi:hypothetical protein